jgi:hypothetical protein
VPSAVDIAEAVLALIGGGALVLILAWLYSVVFAPDNWWEK